MIPNLFHTNKTNREQTFENAKVVEGLQIYFDFISDLEEKELITKIDSNEWLFDLKRKVQHYGYKYNYRSRRIDNSFYIGSIPNWMNFLIKRLNEKNIIDFIPDQAIVNEYIDDQGIAPHIDCESCFGETVISISLSGSCVINFERILNSKNKIPFFLEQRTLLVMTGESRFNWYHGIPCRKCDDFNGAKLRRGRRISITFRKVKLT